jgi:hypothetical protein
LWIIEDWIKKPTSNEQKYSRFERLASLVATTGSFTCGSNGGDDELP